MNDSVLPLAPVPTRAWMAVSALGISAFSIVTCELAPVGMLSVLAKDLHQTESGMGMVITAYGWVAALAALLCSALPGWISRKALLVALMLILALSCLVTTGSHTMPLFISARMVGALAHGAFWALIGVVASQIVPPQNLGLATSVIFAGVSAASVLGVPLSSFIADVAGWRSAFTVIALLSVTIACALFSTLPRLSPPPSPGRHVYYAIVKNPVLLALYGATACIISAHFAAFTYLQPLLIHAQKIPAASISGLLLLAGLSGLIGNIIAGKFIDNHLKGLVSTSLLISAAGLGMLGVSHAAPLPIWLTAMLLAIWAAGIAIVFVGMQTWLLRSAGDAAQPASAIYVAIFNAAIGTGALVGGQALGLIGLQGVALLAAGVIVGSVMLIAMLKSPARQT